MPPRINGILSVEVEVPAHVCIYIICLRTRAPRINGSLSVEGKVPAHVCIYIICVRTRAPRINGSLSVEGKVPAHICVYISVSLYISCFITPWIPNYVSTRTPMCVHVPLAH